ncbi:uncharacterized protein ASPGLDRAFT_29231 [Aspergillus glaucus CBS 516.65]|uniref:Uncharacterized protein n=1 Tax=Aspergillus glaucus CBS 516.65 TaxID=1160497 RepID=A0A1L9V8M5_ASPGL|nr:hypothetical protein ASPGLDRAFT_29231 [Aspergillus glaucus CBS 516.65]OJJ80243.1 hypothetical protein ASPGLDRAFT_29231 [Aspergillus glaucus CBS 516.65]
MPCKRHRDDRFAEYARDFAAHGDMKRKKEGKGEGKVRTLGYHLTTSHLLTGNNKKRKSSKRDFTSQRSGKNADFKHENGNNPRNAANPTSPISNQRKGYSWKPLLPPSRPRVMCSDPVPLLSSPFRRSDWLVVFGCRGGVHPESRVIHTIKYDTRLRCINTPNITLERHRVPCFRDSWHARTTAAIGN